MKWNTSTYRFGGDDDPGWDKQQSFTLTNFLPNVSIVSMFQCCQWYLRRCSIREKRIKIEARRTQERHVGICKILRSNLPVFLFNFFCKHTTKILELTVDEAIREGRGVENLGAKEERRRPIEAMAAITELRRNQLYRSIHSTFPKRSQARSSAMVDAMRSVLPPFGT
jgi:hypothetical protein